MGSADGKVLAAFLRGIITSLDTVTDIAQSDPVEVAVEVQARRLAAEKLTKALSTLLTDKPHGTLPDVRDSFDV